MIKICGGIKVSRKFIVAKEDQISREMSRLARLRSGEKYSWPLTSGVERLEFDGHSRKENLDSVWRGKIARHVKIEAEQFAERNTVKGTGNFVHFRMPNNKAIHAIVTTDNKLRIVTQASYGNVSKVHCRMPDLVDKE